MAGQGKFDALTKELITHVLGFQEGEENFVRSEQFVLSNLLYHHCLAVNSHAVRRSVDGLALKFTIHGQHRRAKRLTDLTTRFLALPLFKDHFEADIEWSLLSVLLHLSNSPTQVPVAADPPTTTSQDSLPPTPGHEEEEKEEKREEKESWAAYLNNEEEEYSVGPEEPLSDWSSEEESEDQERVRSPPATIQAFGTCQPLPQESHLPSSQSQNLIRVPQNLFTLPTDIDPQSLKPIPQDSNVFIPQKDPTFVIPQPDLPRHPLIPSRQVVSQVNTTQETLEQLHRAKSWLSAKTHVQYWGPKCPSQPVVSDHPAANVAKLWEMNQGMKVGSTQQVGEWGVMREGVWALICPTPSYVFTCDTQGSFSLRRNLTLPTLTPGATTKLLAYLCEPLTQLGALDTFTRHHQSAGRHPHTSPPITLLAYATGLRCWRQRFRSHLRVLEERIKEQESTCTLLWLEGELHPWLRTLATIHSVHCAALATPQDASASSVAIRLLGTLCEAVDSVGEGGVRVVLVRLLLHSLRHYLSIIHTWLLYGLLHDQASEFVVKRDESVKVEDERFWRKAFTVSLQHDHTHDSKDPVKTMLKFLSPLLATLTSVGKTRELLLALESPALLTSSIFAAEGQLPEDTDVSLEETLVRYIKEAICKPSKESHMEDEAESTDDTDKMGCTEEKERKRKMELQVTPIQDQTDPILWAAFSVTQKGSVGGSLECQDMDTVTSLIEEISEAPHAISSISLLSSAIRPLVAGIQVRLNARLIRSLLDHHHLDRHCQAVRAVCLMEAGDVMHEFYSHLFAKVDAGECVNASSLTLHLQYCVTRLHPELAQYFSITLPQSGDAAQTSKEGPASEAEDATGTLLIDEVGGSGREALKRMHEKVRQPSKVPCGRSFSAPLTHTGLPELQIQYQAPWPANLLLTEVTMTHLNLLFNFLLCLKRVTNGLERLKFKDLSGWHLATIGINNESENSRDDTTASPLPSRLHRLQLLRHWLLCFSRELHNHFANAVFLPYHSAVERLFQSRPTLNTILTEHDKLLKKLLSECLMGGNEKVLPLQIVLNKVFELTRRLSELWVSEAGGAKGSEVTRLETQYTYLHRYLAHFLTTFVTTRFVPHMEGLTRTLVDTVPLLSQS